MGGGMGRQTVRAILAIGVLAGAGCSEVLGIQADRYVADPADAGRNTSGDDAFDDAASTAWSCLSRPNEVLDPNLHVDLTVLVMNALDQSVSAGSVDGGSDLDTISGVGLPGVAVRPCTLRDPDCMNAPDAAMTDDGGRVVFSLSGDFAGFFDFRRPDLVPSTLYPGNLLAGQPSASFPAFLIDTPTFVALAQAASGTSPCVDPEGGLGHVIVTVYDCNDHQAPGVSVTYDNQAASVLPFYFKDGLPSTAAKATDSFGLAGAINIPKGALAVNAFVHPAGDAAPTPIGNINVVVRPAAITFAWIRVRTH
jgi:hypothetical protein